MKKMMVVCALVLTGCVNGIVSLPDFPNGVAICEKEYHSILILDEAIVWSDGVATFVANPGYEHSLEMANLVIKAHSECN